MGLSNLPSVVRIKKVISLLVTVSFIFSNTAFADISKQSPQEAKKIVQATTDPSKIVIPRDYGLVKSRYTAKDSKKLVIHIQDAHCNYEAQSNIIKILECLIKNDGLGLISVEGADGFIDTSWFKAFPDDQIKKEVADYFMKKGEITGPEFLSITSDLPIKLFGAETRSYYIENLNAFTSSYPLKEDTEKYFNQIKAAINKLKAVIYSAELKELDARNQDYESKKISFTDYVKYLETLGVKHKMVLRQYENLFKLVSVLIYEKKIDFNVVDKERASLIDVITKKLDKEQLTELVNKSLEFKVGKIASAEYYSYLKGLAAKYGVSLPNDYPNLFNYIIYNSVYSRIENEQLFNDIKKFEEAVKEKIFANDDQRTLDKLSRHINILLGLTNIKLLNGDFDYYKANREAFSHEAFAGFIDKMAARYGFAYEVDPPSEAVIESMPRLEDFYAIAIKRDKALVDNTLRAMKKEDALISVLVTGGFHTEGISKLLEKEKTSYIVVCPNITKDAETPYIKILTNQRTPLEEILSEGAVTADAKNVKDGMLAPYLITADLIKETRGRTEADLKAWARMNIASWLPHAVADLAKMHIEPSAETIEVRFSSDVDAALERYAASNKLKDRELKTLKESAEKVKKLALPIIEQLLSGQAYGNMIGKITADDGCIIDKVVSKLSAEEDLLILKDISGRELARLGVGGKANRGLLNKALISIVEQIKNSTLPLSDFDNKVASAIIKHLLQKSREGKIYLLKENPERIVGFSDDDKIFISATLVDNPVAVLREGGESYFALNSTERSWLESEGLNPHVYLSGLGHKSRPVDEESSADKNITVAEKVLIEKYAGLGLQDKLFGENANNSLSRLISLSSDIADLIEKSQDIYATIVGKENREKGYRLSIERLGAVRIVRNIITDPVVAEDEKQLIAKFIAFGKGGVFKFWGELTDTQKRALIDQIKSLDLEAIEKLYQKFVVRKEEGAAINVSQENLTSPAIYDIRETDSAANKDALSVGESAFRSGEVAILELAGGSGARLGYYDPKMMLGTSQVQDKSLGRMRAERIRALAEQYGRPVPWIIMTSDVTHEKTVKFFNDRIIDGKYFGEVPVGEVKFVRQRIMPVVTDKGEFILGGTRDECASDDEAKNIAKYHITVGGFGHGDARDWVLKDKEVIKWLKKFGVKYVMTVNVDNAFLAGPRTIGYHIITGRNVKPGTEHVSKLVIEKSGPLENVGNAVLLDGQDSIIEYNQIPPELAYIRFVYVMRNQKFLLLKEDDGSIGISSLEDFMAMLGRKEIDSPKAIEEWVKKHCLSVDQIPANIKIEFFAFGYTKETLKREATLWIRMGSINTLVFDLSLFTDESHPLRPLPVVVARNKKVDGYQPETMEYNPKEGSRINTNKFEIMQFHGFLVGDARGGAHVMVGRRGEGREGGFAPIKQKKEDGPDNIDTAKKLLSSYDAYLLQELLPNWYVSSEAIVELSPRFAFLDGRYLPYKIGNGGVIGKGAQFYLSGTNTTIGNNFNLSEGKRFTVRVNDEYNPNARVQIGNNVEVKDSVSFNIIGAGQVIVDDGVVFEGEQQFVVGEGEVVHITKTGISRTSSSVGAIRANGGTVSATDHGTRLKGHSIYAEKRQELAKREDSLNGALARPLSNGNAYAVIQNNVKLPQADAKILLTTDKSDRMQELQKRLAAEAPGKSFIVVKGFKDELRKAGLEHLTDVVFHYGVTRQAVYIDEEDLNYLFSLPNGVDIIVEGALHEKAHIDNETANLGNPEVKLLSEEEIDRIAPSYNIMIAIRLKGVNVQELLKISETKISEYLTTQFDKKNISKELYDEAMKATYKNLETWVTDPDIQRVSPNTKLAILDAIKDAVDTNNWADIVDVFRKDVSFGTAGIREKAALTEEALKKLAQYGPGAAVLKGPNTINDIVLLIKTAGVIQYAKKNGLHKVAIGYDSRIAGKQFAELIAQSFLAHSTSEHKFTVYLFDEASPFPELSFAVTTKAVRADLGILISASHNPSNYNGYKITDYTGAQLTGKMRDAIVETIKGVGPKDIQLKPLEKAEDGQLIWLGGKERLYGKDYKDGKYHRQLIDMHTLHAEQVKKFIIDKEVVRQNASKVKIGYSAFNGAGNRAVPRLLSELGFTDTKVITSLQEMNGMFPAFGWGEQPDPGDSISADIAVREFIKEHGREAFDALDILIGTDPDADRAGIIVKVPEAQQKYFGKYKLLSANDAWTLLLWYRIQRLAELSGGKLPDADKKYITFSHVTTDALEKVGELFGVRSLGEMRNKKGEEAGGYLNGRRSWVGFSLIAEFCQKAREKGLTNLGGAEESNGFSILGGPTKENEVLADDGHVNDKDGAFAALLLAEVAAYAKSMNTTLFELLDNIYLNPKVGYFATANKPMPRVGAFKGAEGVTKKINLLKKAQEWAADANKRSGTKDPFTMAGLSVIGAMEFKTTKYDKDHYEGFPDEGIRFFFADSGLNPGDSFTMSRNYITIRPSGTSQTIRFYTQLFGIGINGQNLGDVKYQTARRAEAISLQAQVELLAAANYMEDIANIETQLKSLGFIPKNVVQFIQGKASIDLPVINSTLTSEQAAQIISQKLHTPLVAATAEMAARFMQGGYNQPGYGVPAGASIDGSFAIGNEGNQGYYVNGGKEIFLSTTASMRDFFERRARILGTPIKYVIKPGIGGQHTPFQSIASTFQVIDVEAGTVIGEYELGKDYEASLLAAINKLGIKWEEIAVIPSSKSGSTDETMMIFNEIFYVLLKHISNLSYQSVNGEEFAQLVFDTLHEVNFINGKERSAKDLFKVDRERFKTDSLIDLIAMRAADRKMQLTRDMVQNIFGKVLGNMFFETTDRPESSRLSAFIRNSGLDKELGENAPGFGGMFDNVGGRWTADLHMMTFLAYHKLDAEAYWNVRYEGIKQVREGTHQANTLAKKILNENITDIALVVPNELFWFGKAMEQNFNESIWQKGFANLVAIKESAWEAQKSHYAGKPSRLVINISSLDIPESSFEVADLGEFKLGGVKKQELANSLGELFTTFYGMTHTYGNTLIVQALAEKGFTVADVDLNNLDNPATKIVQRNLYIRQPYVELGKGLLENKLKALQERGPQAIEEELGRIKEAARNGRLEMTSSEINFHDEIKNVEQLAGVIKQAVKFAEKTNRKFVPFIYLEGEKFLELRELLVNLGIEWVMQGTGDQHISYQQVLAQPQKYMPFIVSFVPENMLSGRPAIGFAKGYLHNVSPNMVRDLFAEASYKALTDPRKNEAGEAVLGAAGIFLRITDSDDNRDMLARSFEAALNPGKEGAKFDHTIATVMKSSNTGERARKIAVNLFKAEEAKISIKKHLIFVKSAIPSEQLATTTAINYANYCADYYNEMEGYTADVVDTYEDAIKLLAKNSDWDKTNTIVGLIDKWALDKITAELEKNGMQDKTKLLPMETFDKDQFVPLKGFFDLMSVLVHVNRPLNRPEDQELRDTIKDLLNEIGVRDVNSLINALSVAAYFEDPIKFARNFIIRLLPPTKAASLAELRDRYNAAKKVVESL